MIVECYLEAKYYDYDPANIYELVDFNVNVENLVESHDIVTVQNIETDEYSAIQNGSNTINPDTPPKIQVVLFVWKN